MAEGLVMILDHTKVPFWSQFSYTERQMSSQHEALRLKQNE
jgi:hypothetical protein